MTDSIDIAWPSPGDEIVSPRLNNTFRIGNVLGDGFFSVVYECSDLWGNQLVAKVLKPNNQPFESVQAKAILETNALEALRHPYVVYIHDAFEFGSLFYIIVERCANTVSDIITSADFSGSFWLRPIARCLLQALQYAHTIGVTHCDIHPGNVLFQFPRNEATAQSGTSLVFKLSDLGVARLSNDIDVTGTFLNSIRPPECIRPDLYGTPDHRVDIYQAALLFLQLLRGEMLQYSDEEKLAGQPRFDALALGEPFAPALEKALRRTVIHRTCSALEFWNDLKE